MRLINITTFALQEFIDNETLPIYAILSHCWDAIEKEVSYQQLRSGALNEQSTGWYKLSECCRLAKERGLEWAWVDTCCIDKSSSAELTEAINSMSRWYKQSNQCYVYMADVDASDLPQRLASDSLDGRTDSRMAYLQSFMRSRWFARGWTLHELLAPSSVEIFRSRLYVLWDKSRPGA